MRNDAQSVRPIAPSTRRACDACKRRKVRCDTTSSPCSNCAIACIQCSYTITPKRRGPKRKLPQRQISPSSPQNADLGQHRDLTASQSDDGREFEYEAIRPQADTQQVYDGASPRESHLYCSPMQEVQGDLRRGLAAVTLQQPLAAIANRCITLYIEYLFPVAPIIHEHSIRSFAPLLELQLDLGVPPPQPSSPLYYEKLSRTRNWTLLTALCAATAFLLPPSIFPERDVLGHHFLRASRDMLKIYQDLDIEQPDYSSLAIRYYHSNALHAVGKTRVSWHVLGEAVRLTQEMRLYDEQSYHSIDSLESHLRKTIFWQIYTADKSAAILNDRPIALHEICLGVPVTTSYPLSQGLPLRPPILLPSAGSMERYVVTGFNLCQDLWMRASDLIVRLDAAKTLRIFTEQSTVFESIREAVARDHLRFISTLDDLSSDTISVTPTLVHSECTVVQVDRVKNIQRTNLLVTFHCLRLVLLQKFVENGLSSLLGISGDAHALALRKTEIASDAIRAISESPFESLQVNGEPCVEKIRRIGVTLLEIVHEVNSPGIVDRAKSLFLMLLDILARLDSRVSEELSMNRGF